MYSQASLHTQAASPEDALRIGNAFPLSRDHYDKSLYVESARRVVFKNCMEKCELDNESVPNFNKNFYYNMQEAQVCLSSCFNFRMKAHFGSDATKTDGLQLDFDQLKSQYQSYEMWFPKNKLIEKYSAGFKEDEVREIINRLKEKTQAAS